MIVPLLGGRLALVIGGLLCVAGALILLAGWRGWALPPWVHRRKAPDPAVSAFVAAWAAPAYDAARTILQGVQHTLQQAKSPAKRDLAVTVQDRLDVADAAHSRVINDPSDESLGAYHRAYQGLSSWILKGTEYNAVDLAGFWYGEWRARDKNFLDHLREFSATPDRTTLLRLVKECGWGEGVRHQLPPPEHTP